MARNLSTGGRKGLNSSGGRRGGGGRRIPPPPPGGRTTAVWPPGGRTTAVSTAGTRPGLICSLVLLPVVSSPAITIQHPDYFLNRFEGPLVRLISLKVVHKSYWTCFNTIVNVSITLPQGWEFAHRFSERIAQKNKWFAHSLIFGGRPERFTHIAH